MLASMLPEALRYDDRARAVCLRLEWALDAIAPLRAAPVENGDGVTFRGDPGVAAGLRRAE